VRGLQVRLERAPKVSTASELRTALRTAPTEQDTASTFITVSDKLSPGESAPFSVSLPLRGNLDNSPGLTEAGVYPMLVNVNGEPDFGGRARLDVAHFLLPVLSLPPDPGAANPPAANPPAANPPAAPPKQGQGATTGITVLWPLADRPRLRPSAFGAPALLSDDDLARSFAAGGRLDGLLQAVEQRTTPGADPTGALGNSLCLGVDPDLLVTAEDMIRGYQVLGANGQTRAGTGGPDANAWLQRLKAVAKQRCVLAMPWSQADLNALSRASLPDLVSAAVASGRDVVAKSLGLPAVTDVVWPDGGFLTERAAAGLPRLGAKTVLVSGDGVDPAQGSGLAPGTGTVKLAFDGGTLGAGLIDAPAEAALAATGSGADRQLRLQDALGAMTWPAITTAQSAADGGTRSARGAATGAVLLAPPQVWDIDGDQAQTVLDSVSALLQSGAATAAPLPALVNGATTSPTTAQLDYPVQAASAEVPPRTTSAIASTLADLDQFSRALQRDPQSGVTPDDLLSPLQFTLLRAASTSVAEDDAAAASEVDAARQALTRLHDEVSLQAPSGTYTLASAQSPLLLVVRNDLPVSIDVRVSVDAPAG
ncbi:MAG: glycoprotein, partial [Mycobacteriaceae bacterium]